jgi:hypothetical protein
MGNSSIIVGATLYYTPPVVMEKHLTLIHWPATYSMNDVKDVDHEMKSHVNGVCVCVYHV